MIRCLLLSLVFCLPFIAHANTLGGKDFAAVSKLDSRGLLLLKDIIESEKAMDESRPLSNRCMSYMRNDLLVVASEVEHLRSLTMISSEVINKQDEALALRVTRIQLDRLTNTVKSLRSQVNEVAGTCSENALVPVKAQEILRYFVCIRARPRVADPQSESCSN